MKWYRRAADQGNADAQSACERLERRTGEAQAAEAEEKSETGRASRRDGFWSTLGKQIVGSLMPATTNGLEETASRQGDQDDLSTLTLDIAENFLKDSDAVDLEEFTSITDDAAAALIKHEGNLFLDGLTSLSDAAAAALAKH